MRLTFHKEKKILELCYANSFTWNLLGEQLLSDLTMPNCMLHTHSAYTHCCGKDRFNQLAMVIISQCTPYQISTGNIFGYHFICQSCNSKDGERISDMICVWLCLAVVPTIVENWDERIVCVKSSSAPWVTIMVCDLNVLQGSSSTGVVVRLW